MRDIEKVRKMLRWGYQGLKEIDLIWVILKKSKSLEEKEKENILDTKKERYTYRYYKHASKISAKTNKYR